MLFKTELPLNPKIFEDVHILVVDDDRDTRDLYTFLLEEQGAKVTASESVQEALDFLDGSIPNLLICEMRFLGESVLPLIQRVRSLASSSGRLISILVTSTCSPISFTQQLTVKVEAYLLKPLNIDDFIDQVWNLTLASGSSYLPSIPLRYPPSIQSWVMKSHPKMLRCGAGVG